MKTYPQLVPDETFSPYPSRIRFFFLPASSVAADTSSLGGPSPPLLNAFTIKS